MSRPALVLIPQHFGCLVFDRRNSRYFPFDRESTDLLRRLAVDPDASDEEPGFAEHFYQRGFFRFDGRLDAEVLPIEPPADHLAGPLAVHLEIAAACNLTCRHCFAGVLPRREPALSLERLDALFAELASLGSLRLGLTGGEPLLRRDLLELLDSATEHGLHPCITTNGLLIDERMARELGKRKLVWLNVSLEGAYPESNDPIRGEGTFARVIDKLKLLGRHARFTLAFTVTSANAAEVRECAALAREVGASAAVFRPLYPVGVAVDHLELMPSYEEYVGALDSLTGDVHGIDPFSPQSRAETRAKTYEGAGCGAANLVCSVSMGGQVNPCSFLGPEFQAGSLREHSFRHLWDHSQSFQRLRGVHDEAFAGGCRARAQTLAGSVHAADPWQTSALLQQSRSPAANLEVG